MIQYPPPARCMTIAGWMFRSSKRLTQKPRTLQPISPGQLDRLGDPDAYARGDLRFVRARMQRDRRFVERQAIMRAGDAECLRQLARTRAQRPLVMQSAPAPHGWDAVGRLKCADQHRAGGAFLFADEIDAPVNAVGAVDIGKTRRPGHHPVARRRPAERMRGRIGAMIGLDLDDDAADAVDQQRRANQIGGDFMDAAGEEGALERFAELLLACGSVLGHSGQYAKTGPRPRRAVAVLGPPD